jgi:hypothetical protein
MSTQTEGETMKAGWLSLRAAARTLGCTCYSVNRAAARGVIRTRIAPLTGVLEFACEDVLHLKGMLSDAVAS